MVTIKTIDKNNAELKVQPNTPHTTILLGVEMLVEMLLDEVPSMTIDDLLDDIKRIYIRDNKEKVSNRKEEVKQC